MHVLGLDLGSVPAVPDRHGRCSSTLALTCLVERTRFGAQIRASVDNQQASVGLGINVERVFSVTFALGSALAGLGGALGIDVLGLDPTFPLKYMVYFLLVVAVGGAGTITRTADRGADPRRVRRRRQVLRAADRRLRHLRR